MSTAKLRIDLSQGLIDVEGSEGFVLEVYNDFKARMQSVPAKREVTHGIKGIDAPQPATSETPTLKLKNTKSASSATAKLRKGSREEHSMVTDLDLSNTKAGRLKDFVARFVLKTNMERNLAFVYFMQHEMELANIAENHIFTCYRHIGVKVPGALRQSLFDTSSAKGWVNTSHMDDIRVTTIGMNHLEHDLPKATPAE